MKKKIVNTFMVILITIVVLTIVCFRLWYDVAETAKDGSPDKNINYTEIIKNAKEIEIREATVSLGKEYRLYVDDKRVGTITGDFMMNKILGDTFVMNDFNDNFIVKEHQIKRWGVKINRAAEISDNNDNPLGYIGENNIKSLFSMTRVFYFYDKEQNEIGKSKELFSFVKKNKFFDSDGNLDYYSVQQWNFITDVYKLEVYDTSNVSIEQAILAVCIDDAIKDNKKND